MVVADASVWIDFFNARPNPARDLLRKLLHEGDTRVVVPDLVLFEVLRGFRDERQLRQARGLMMSLEVAETSGVDLCLQAAQHYRDLRKAGFETVGGNAVKPEVLLKAGLDKATHLFVAVPSPFEAARIIEQARVANPGCEIIARAYTDADVALLKTAGATHALIGEEEIARGMLARAPRKKPPAAAH